MTELRAQIDRVDVELMSLLAERVTYIDRAIEIKLPIDLPARIDERVEEVAMNARKNAENAGFNPDLAEQIWRIMIEWSIAREDKILRREPNDSENHRR